MRKFLPLVVLLLILLLPVSVFAHPGKTDGKGGHWNHSTGEYHYHHGYSAHDHYDMDGDGKKDCPYDFKNTSGADFPVYSGSSKSYEELNTEFDKKYGTEEHQSAITYPTYNRKEAEGAVPSAAATDHTEKNNSTTALVTLFVTGYLSIYLIPLFSLITKNKLLIKLSDIFGIIFQYVFQFIILLIVFVAPLLFIGLIFLLGYQHFKLVCSHLSLTQIVAIIIILVFLIFLIVKWKSIKEALGMFLGVFLSPPFVYFPIYFLMFFVFILALGSCSS